FIVEGIVFDCGCGDGTFLQILHKQYGDSLEYEGSDISEKALEYVPGFVRKTYITDLEKSRTFPKKKFDAVICSEVLEHIKDWRLAIKNLAKVTADKGFMLITVPHGTKYWGINDKFANHYRRFEIGQIEKELEKEGFEIRKRICWGWPFYWLYYTFFLNNTDPRLTMANPSSFPKRIVASVLYCLFFIDDLFNTRKGRRLFIVAEKI
ncbi:class I SAM-dependent methyltransferase, partial [Candidatus Woesearchaeota archaeon]|nr:class I SAM-dependent methyltransferase [Candidatus Woesearchaeota archaeon]